MADEKMRGKVMVEVRDTLLLGEWGRKAAILLEVSQASSF
jgi:hypothetical protein